MNFEYEDFYKFIASLGIGLATLAVLVPWLFLRESFDLQVKQSDIETLTPVAQAVLQQRQLLVQRIFTVLPCLSAILFVVGSGLTMFGGTFWWRKTQKIQDEIHRANLAILNRQLQPATKDEVRNERQEEARSENTDPAVIDAVVAKALAIEERVVQKLTRCLNSTFEILSNKRLGDVFFDIILVSKDQWRKDAVIEVKYSTKEITYDWLRTAALTLSNKNRLYQLSANSIPIPVLLVIAGHETLSAVNIEEFSMRIEQERIFRKGKSRILFLSEEELDTIPCSRLEERVGV